MDAEEFDDDDDEDEMKNDDDEDDSQQVFGVTTVINLTSRKVSSLYYIINIKFGLFFFYCYT